MQKPNVLFISSWYPSREHPTLGNFAQRHAESINPFVNLYVLYIASSENIDSNLDFELKTEVINGVNTTIVYYRKVNSKIPFFNSIKKLKRYRAGYKLGFEEIVKKNRIDKFDICHCNVTFPAGLIALDLKKEFKIPYILTEHWTLFLPYKNDYKKLPFYIKNKMKEIVKEAERVVPVSSHLRNSMIQKGLKGNYTVIPNVVDTELFNLGEDTENEVKNILHVSTLVENHKNIHGIFSTLKKIAETRSDFKLTIVSDGDIERAKEIQKNNGLADKFVEYHSTKTPEEISEFYKKADFFLLFSNYENLPVVISESLCCGLPVVSSSVGGIPEMIDNSNGLIVNPGDKEGLKEAVIKLLDNIGAYSKQEIRNNAIKKYENKVVGKKYYKLYNKLI